jgi:hypothetical protein
VPAAFAADSLDRLERRYAKIYPLTRVSRLTLQFFATFVVVGFAALLAGLLLYAAMAAAGSPAALQFSYQLVASAAFLGGMWLGGSYWIVLSLVNRMWRPIGLFWAIFALVVLNYNIRDFARLIVFVSESSGVLALPDAAQFLLDYGLVALCCCYLWVGPIMLLRGAWALLVAPREQCAIMRETPSGRPFARNAFNTLLGLPPLIDFVHKPRGRYLKIVALSSLAGLFLASAGLGAMGALVILFDAYVGVLQSFPDLAWPIIGLPFGLAGILFALAVTGGVIERAELGQIRFSLEALQEVDLRQPVLFLRAFADDQVELLRPKVSYLARTLDFGRRKANLDEMLLAEATPYGPLVALGNPTDALPPYGAARGYFDDKTWQEAVEDLVRTSSLVILCVDATDGIWWEVEHLALTSQFGKTLILIHPSHRAAAANRSLMEKFIATLGTRKGWVEALAKSGAKEQSVFAFFLEQDGELKILRSSTFSQFAYLLAIRMFIRAKLGLPGAGTGRVYEPTR